MYRCQLSFEMFCATSALARYISWQYLNHSNLLLYSVYQLLVYFHVQIILHQLSIPLSKNNGFGNIKNSYIRSEY